MKRNIWINDMQLLYENIFSIKHEAIRFVKYAILIVFFQQKNYTDLQKAKSEEIFLIDKDISQSVKM